MRNHTRCSLSGQASGALSGFGTKRAELAQLISGRGRQVRAAALELHAKTHEREPLHAPDSPQVPATARVLVSPVADQPWMPVCPDSFASQDYSGKYHAVCWTACPAEFLLTYRGLPRHRRHFVRDPPDKPHSSAETKPARPGPSAPLICRPAAAAPLRLRATMPPVRRRVEVPGHDLGPALRAIAGGRLRAT